MLCKQKTGNFKGLIISNHGGEYTIDSVVTKTGRILHRLRYDYVKSDESFSSFPKATKLAFLPDEYDNITETVRVKIHEMHEVMYKKGYEWISSIAITKCEIIPFGSKPEEKMKDLSEKYKQFKNQETEDDFLF